MKNIRVNMTRLEVTTEKIPAGQELIGGRCLTARTLNQEVSPGIDPLSADAKLIIAMGPLAGTNASSLGRLSIGAKSPLTHGIKESNVGGPAGQKIDRLGIRSVIIEGCPADDSMYVLYLSPDNYSLEKADDLKGLKNNDTATRLRDKTNSNITVVSIGLGGERRWKSAAITCTDKDGRCSRHAARGGLGSVMGAKGLKAIVIDDKGAPRIPLKSKNLFRETQKQFAELVKTDPQTQDMSTMGTPSLIDTVRDLGSMPVLNYGSAPLRRGSKTSTAKR